MKQEEKDFEELAPRGELKDLGCQGQVGKDLCISSHPLADSLATSGVQTEPLVWSGRPVHLLWALAQGAIVMNRYRLLQKGTQTPEGEQMDS